MRLMILLGLLACDGEPEETDTPGDSGSADTDTDTDTGDAVEVDICEDAPVATWENFGQGFMTENCQSCHASTASNRRGAPIGATFDDLESTLVWTDRILARATGDNISMPPQGGVGEDDRYLLEVWLTCWEDPQ